MAGRRGVVVPVQVPFAGVPPVRESSTTSCVLSTRPLYVSRTASGATLRLWLLDPLQAPASVAVTVTQAATANNSADYPVIFSLG